MSHDLSLAQSHAFQLSRDLMVPVTVFEVDGELRRPSSDEIDASDDLDIVHEFFPGSLSRQLPFRVPLATCRRQGSFAAGGATLHLASRALAPSALRGGRKMSPDYAGS